MQGPTTMKKTLILSEIASAMMSVGSKLGFNPEKERPETHAIQHKPIPAKTGNVLYDTINYMNSHMIFKGLRYPSRKTVGRKGSSGARSACQIRAQIV